MITPRSTRLRRVSSDLCRVSVLLLALATAARSRALEHLSAATGMIVGRVRVARR